jgi:hypothetical protein
VILTIYFLLKILLKSIVCVCVNVTHCHLAYQNMKKKGAYRIKMNKDNISLVVEVFYLCNFTRYASLFLEWVEKETDILNLFVIPIFLTTMFSKLAPFLSSDNRMT